MTRTTWPSSRDRGDLVIQRNLFDLESSGLRFTPNEEGGYDVARVGLAPARRARLCR